MECGSRNEARFAHLMQAAFCPEHVEPLPYTDARTAGIRRVEPEVIVGLRDQRGSIFAWPYNAVSELTEVPVVCVFPHVLFGWGVK